jgi:hypothetical protein
MSATYGLTGHPSDTNPLGPGAVKRFDAASLADAQTYAQTLSTIFQTKIVLLNDNGTSGLGTVRTVYTPGTAGASVAAPASGIVHR